MSACDMGDPPRVGRVAPAVRSPVVLHEPMVEAAMGKLGHMGPRAHKRCPRSCHPGQSDTIKGAFKAHIQRKGLQSVRAAGRWLRARVRSLASPRRLGRSGRTILEARLGLATRHNTIQPYSRMRRTTTDDLMPEDVFVSFKTCPADSPGSLPMNFEGHVYAHHNECSCAHHAGQVSYDPHSEHLHLRAFRLAEEHLRNSTARQAHSRDRPLLI